MRSRRCQRGEKAAAGRRRGKTTLSGGIIRIVGTLVSDAWIVRVFPVNLSKPPGHTGETSEVLPPLFRREIGGSFARHVGGERSLFVSQLLWWSCAPPFVSYDCKSGAFSCPP